MTVQARTELLLATNNRGKVLELTALLAHLPLRLRTLADFRAVSEVEETGLTFAENALLKARFYARQTGRLTLADDSGLEVEALGGAPGVFSARYGGPGATDGERTELLLGQLAKTGDAERKARFVCVLALVEPNTGEAETFVGICAGRIAHVPKGSHGFGYDPVFIPTGYEQTFGELPAEIKQQISHRARALTALRAFLAGRLGA